MTKNKTILATLLLSSLCLPLKADNYLQTLKNIVGHSIALSTAQARTTAEQKDNLTGLTLDNPEVEFSYQWGRPSALTPDKKTLDISQSFDLATLSGARSAVARATNRALDADLELTRTETTALVDNLMTEAVYRARTAEWFNKSLAQYETLRKNVEKSVELGEMTIIDLNAVKIEEMSMQAEAKLNQLELDALLDQLDQNVRDIKIDWHPEAYMDYSLPTDFEQWCREYTASDPALSAARSQVDVAIQRISLSKREGLPQFSLGYTSEMVTDANYYGVTIGVSLPLWANKGRVKAAKAAKAAAQTALEDATYSYVAQLRLRYDKARSLLSLLENVRQLRQECDIKTALDKMMQKGSLSLHEYISQIQGLYTLDRKIIDAEHDYQAALTELRAGRIQ